MWPFVESEFDTPRGAYHWCHAFGKKKEIGNRLYYWPGLVEKLDQLIARLTANARRGSNGSDQFCALKMSLMPGQLWFSRLSAVLSTLSYVGREASKCVKK